MNQRQRILVIGAAAASSAEVATLVEVNDGNVACSIDKAGFPFLPVKVPTYVPDPFLYGDGNGGWELPVAEPHRKPRDRVGVFPMRRNQPKPPIEERPCLNCGKTKQHNNAYCSADCCRAHRAKTKGEQS